MQVNEKRLLRQTVRGRSPGDVVRTAESKLLCRHVLAWEVYQAAQMIGGYMPMAHEADITPILRDALASGKTLALPRCAAGQLIFHRVLNLNELRRGAYGIMEPAPDAPIVPVEKIELLLTPLEAIDRDGMRLGKGGGYYDRLLQETSIPAVGMVMSWQWVDSVPAYSWDKPLPYAADQTGIHEMNHPERIV